MAIFLDDTMRLSSAQRYSDSIVHSYNKRAFSDYDTALETLMNKVLLPGEVTFAYYNDSNATYGLNAIAAVGPLTHGSGNIIFKNSDSIDSLHDTLAETIADVNASVNYLEEKLDNTLDDLLDGVNSSIDELWSDVQTPLNRYNERLSVIETEYPLADTSIVKYVNTSILYIKQELLDYDTSIINLVNNVSDGLYKNIIDTSSLLTTYVNDLLRNSFDINNSSIDEKIHDSSDNISNIIFNFRKEIEDYVDDYNDDQDVSINHLYIIVHDLDSSVMYNTSIMYDINHKLLHLYDNIDASVTNIEAKLKTCVDELSISLNSSINEFYKNVNTSVNTINASLLSLIDKLSARVLALENYHSEYEKEMESILYDSSNYLAEIDELEIELSKK